MDTRSAEPSTVGEILLEEFVKPVNLSTETLAREIGFSDEGMASLLRNDHRLSQDEARRLAEYFNVAPDFWVNLQTAPDRWAIRCEEKALPV